MQTQLQHMLSLQHQMNSIAIGPDWIEQNKNWYRAIWIESAEMLDHFGWKWWKHQDSDTEQVKLELVDIWHFMLSVMLQINHFSWIESDRSMQDLCDLIQNDWSRVQLKPELRTECAENIRRNIEEIARVALDNDISVTSFSRVCGDVGLTFDDLYQQYIAKNVLNIFRQDYGYKDGSYRKRWSDGREDNQHLVDVMSTTGTLVGEELVAHMYNALVKRYNTQ